MQTCKECGDSFSRIGSHWYYNPDHRPPLTDEQKEIISGVLMGDGWIHTQDYTPSLQIKSVTPEYLSWLDSKFGTLGTSVRLSITAKENAQKSRDSDFSPNANREDYSDVYKWNTRCHPELEEFESWYDSGEKVWPKDLELTPMVLKNLYVCDGTFDNNGTSFRILISCSNEKNNKEKVDSIFSNAGFEIGNWKVGDSYVDKYPNKKNVKIEFTANTTSEMFEYMGKPIPGFEYKWPERFITDTT